MHVADFHATFPVSLCVGVMKILTQDVRKHVLRRLASTGSFNSILLVNLDAILS